MMNVMTNAGRRSHRFLALFAVSAFTIASALPAAPLAAQDDARAVVSAVLDALHEAASEADFDRYFSLYAGESRLPRHRRDRALDARGVHGLHESPLRYGHGLTYHMLERHIAIAPGGRTAWFDERLETANLGETRGSGVLVMGRRELEDRPVQPHDPRFPTRWRAKWRSGSGH